MTFSSGVREELAHIDIKNKCCALSELAALVRTCAFIEINKNIKLGIRFDTENPSTARRIFNIIKFLYEEHCEVSAKKIEKLRIGHSYMVRLANYDTVTKILTETGMIEQGGNVFQINRSIPRDLLKTTCCIKSFLRGCYLGCGSMSDPNKSYHLEFNIHEDSLADSVHALLKSFDLNAKITRRKTVNVIYIKESENIIDLFSLIGAHSSLLTMENILILKSVKNNINRTANFEDANLDKSINAAQKQVENIRRLESAGKIKTLPPSLRKAAELRMEYPELTLKELSEISGEITKSGMNHRMRRLMELAKNT